MSNFYMPRGGWLAIRVISSLNLQAAIGFLLFGAVLALRGESQFFEYEDDVYGPMMGNLRLMLVYLGVAEIAVYIMCRMRGKYQVMLLVGGFFIILMASIDFYGFINQVPVDDHYKFLFLYLGLSHLLYGGVKLHLRRVD